MRPLAVGLLPALLLACTGDAPKPDPEVEPTALTDATLTLRGDAGDLAGSAVTAGDLNGDGAEDLVVAGLGGRVTCVTPGPLSAGEHLLHDAPTCIGQAEDYDFAGYALASGVDLDGDGADELLIGGPAHDGGGDSAGAVWLLEGPLPPGAPSVAETDTSWVGLSVGDGLGSAVAFAGDHDGDGVEELLLGAPKSDAGARDDGAVFLVSPVRPAATLTHATLAVFVGGGGAPETPAKHAENVTGDGVGTAVCRAGDLDGDGLGDVVIAAPGWDGGAENGGAAALFAGPIPEGTWGLADADTLLLGGTAGGYLGGALACGGDTDGDGHGELLVGADADGAGRVYLWRAGALADATSFVGESDGDQAGYAVAFLPGAGTADGVAIGAPATDGTDIDAGMVALYGAPLASGTVAPADADARWIGEGAGDLAGTALVGLADLDGAGTPGLLVGAPYNRDPAPIGGAAYGIPAP
ncbi:MAG: integrin alpha [Pseudomonadota bacterium]|nr:integrin alpha [Pseudomonadota bacterium]